jgi:hypothetical protein
MALGGALQGFAQILQQMPAIHNLDGCGRTGRRTLGIALRTIAADYLHSGALCQPVAKRFPFPIRQEVDGPVSLQINQDRAIPLTTPHRPIVNANDVGRIFGRKCGAAHCPEQRVAADRHRQTPR